MSGGCLYTARQYFWATSLIGLGHSVDIFGRYIRSIYSVAVCPVWPGFAPELSLQRFSQNFTKQHSLIASTASVTLLVVS